jgi:hypothetical protein
MMRTARTIVIALACATRLGAQAPAPPDTVPRDTTRYPPHHLLMYPLVAAGFIAFVAAPSALMLIPVEDTSARMNTTPMLAASTVMAYGALGPGDDNQERRLWTLAQGVELFHRGLYAEARVEQFGLRDRNVRLRTIRVGYLAHRRNALGGITVGLRQPAAEGGLRGVEVALPLVMGNEEVEMRLEPLYLISSRNVSWNYRFQAELAIPRSAAFAGVRITSHAFDGTPKESNVALGLLVGLRR